LHPDVNHETKDMAREPITVILVDDHELARHGIRKLLGGDAIIEVVGEAESSSVAISLIAALRPKVVILDIRLRQGNGIAVTKAARKLAPDTRILVLSAYDDSQYVVSLVKLGVSGYLTKDSSGDDLIRAVHYAANGWLVFSPDIACKVTNLLRRNGGGLLSEEEEDEGLGEVARGRSSGSLTGVLRHISRGLRNCDIADAMGISPKTVEIHIHRILLKLGAKNRSQAIVNSLGLRCLQDITVPAGPRDNAQHHPFVSCNVRVSPEGVEGET
jgi:DNA-binding NarL/FixJ family response regulator